MLNYYCVFFTLFALLIASNCCFARRSLKCDEHLFADAPDANCESRPVSHVEAADEVYVLGDLHADVSALRDALILADLIKVVKTESDSSPISSRKVDPEPAFDTRWLWKGGDKILIQLGDQVDGKRQGDSGSSEYNNFIREEASFMEIYYRLKDLQSQAPRSVFLLLGNHELLHATNEFMPYITPHELREFGGAECLAKAFHPGQAWARRLACSRPAVLRLDFKLPKHKDAKVSFVLSHGSFYVPFLTDSELSPYPYTFSASKTSKNEESVGLVEKPSLLTGQRFVDSFNEHVFEFLTTGDTDSDPLAQLSEFGPLWSRFLDPSLSSPTANDLTFSDHSICDYHHSFLRDVLHAHATIHAHSIVDQISALCSGSAFMVDVALSRGFAEHSTGVEVLRLSPCVTSGSSAKLSVKEDGLLEKEKEEDEEAAENEESGGAVCVDVVSSFDGKTAARVLARVK